MFFSGERYISHCFVEKFISKEMVYELTEIALTELLQGQVIGVRKLLRKRTHVFCSINQNGMMVASKRK